MEKKPIPEETGLTFYSKVSASISHELKNALAVINESAGFLEDVTLMAQKGIPLDPSRLASLANTILKQVQRSNTIVKNMNQLAHSLDAKQAVVDLPSLVQLMLHVFERIALMRGVSITGDRAEKAPVSVTTRPFYLETLIWLLLELSMNTCGEPKTVKINVRAEAPGARLEISGLMALTGDGVKEFFSDRTKPLLEALGADLKVLESENRLMVSLPANISSCP